MPGIDPISNIAAASGPLADAIGKIIGIFKASATAKQAGQIEMDEMALQGQIQGVLAQIQVDAVEASNKSIFVAGWRPFVGWVCGCALAYTFIIQPFGQFALVAFKVQFNVSALPVIGLGELMPILLGLLGLGAMRTYEKTQGANAAGDIGH